MKKPVQAWYTDKVERWTAARELKKTDLEVLHFGELKTGPGDLTLAEWDQKMIEMKQELHGLKAYNAVYGPNDSTSYSNL